MTAQFGVSFLGQGRGLYAWLYIGSFGIGLGAVAIALTFRPVHGTPMQQEIGLKRA